MKRIWSKLVITSLTATALLVTYPDAIIKDVYASTNQVSLANQVVKLTSTASISVKEAHMLVQEQGKLLSFTVQVSNSGNKSISLMDYWIKVKSKSNKQFKIKIAEADKTKSNVAAGSSAYLTYYAIVDSNTKLSDMVFEIIQWDFSVAGYERKLGTVTATQSMSWKTPKFKPGIMLYNNSQLKGAIKTYIVTKDQKNTNITIQYLLENVSNKSIDISKLNFYIQSDNLAVYKTDLLSQQQSLSSKERRIISLNVSLPNTIASKALTLITSYAEETSKMELPIGTFEIPALKATVPTAIEKNRSLFIDGQTIQTSVKNTVVSDASNKRNLSTQFVLKNSGNRSVDYSKMVFSIQTASGTEYPLQFDKEAASTLLPNIENVIDLNGQIPSNLNLEKVHIVSKLLDAESNKQFTLGLYKVKNQVLEGSMNTVYKQNDYEVTLQSINRVPDSVEDVISAQLLVSNKNNYAIKIPDISGYFISDGVKLETVTNKVSLDQSISIAPNSTHQIVVYSKVPYTSMINNVSFVLTEKVSESVNKTLFKFAGKFTDTKVISRETPYIIDNVGRRAAVNIKYSAITQSNQNNYFYAEFDLVNTEARTSNVSQLGGYLEDSEGVLVPINFTSTTERVLTGGKVLYAAYAKLPTEFRQSDYKLHMGQSYPITIGESSENLLVNPIAYSMNSNVNINETFKNISFGGHLLNITEINSNIRIKDDFLYEGIELNMKYSMSKDSTYLITPKDQKIMFEFVDQGPSKATYTKEYNLADLSEGEKLAVGNDIRLPIYFADDKMMTKINSFQKYKLNIYTTFGDNRLLLATKEFQWFYLQQL